MQVYVDNKEMKLKRKKYASFGLALNEIINELKKDNKILLEAYVDGKTLEEHPIIDINKLNLLEIKTKSQSQVILDSIIQSRDELIEFLNRYCDTEMVELDISEIYSDLELLHWTYTILIMIESLKITSLNLEYQFGDKFSEYVETFRKALLDVDEILKKEDMRELVYHFSQTIGYLISLYVENSDNLFNNVIMDENSKRLLN